MASVALTIAGSDPSGGAGLQADLKTFHQLGVYGEAVVTLITVQNTRGVTRVEMLAPELVREQIDAVVLDIPAGAAKTGALGNRAIVETVAQAATAFRFPLVVDPVMLSKNGTPLLDHEARSALIGQLIPQAFLLMPNLAEASVLTGMPVNSLVAMKEAAKTLSAMGAANVLIKGGHLTGDPIDLLLTADGGFEEFAGPRIDTRHTHGTGCAYSAAITAELAKGTALRDAVSLAKRYVTEALRTNPGLGTGNGPLNHHADISS